MHVAMDSEIDLLALLESCPAESLDIVVAGEGDEGSGVLIEHSLPSACELEAASSADAGNERGTSSTSLPSMVGKCGSGRHGDSKDQSLLALHMRHCKAMIQGNKFRDDMANILEDSCLRKNGKLVHVRAERTCAGVIIKLTERSGKGNRFRRAIPWCDFLAAAYGKLKRDTHIALAMEISRKTVGFMCTMVGSSYLGQQSSLVGKLIQYTRVRRPLFFIRHLKWDETALWASVNLDADQRRVASSWEVMVARQRIVIGWTDGSCAILRLAMPPVVLLAAGAHHMYYALKYHPMYKSIQSLLDVLGDQCEHRCEIFESDGAYANERLIAHLIQKNKLSEHPSHLVHTKCQNHQTQLVSVALLAAAGGNILNRMYGFAVFVRNLGNWLRLKQALFSWIDEQLLFVQDVATAENPTASHPATMELIEFLRANRKIEAENSEFSPAFERAVDDFLQFWNADPTSDRPCHHCTGNCFPSNQRHCQDRQAAVRGMASSMINLLLSSMPSVPAPNKWATLYPCLET